MELTREVTVVAWVTGCVSEPLLAWKFVSPE